MTLEEEFVEDPIKFMKNYAVRPSGGNDSKIVYMKFFDDPKMSAKKGHFH